MSLTKENKQRCLDLWGCIPTDEDWVLNSKYFEQGNDFATGIVTEVEHKKRFLLKIYLKENGINYS